MKESPFYVETCWKDIKFNSFAITNFRKMYFKVLMKQFRQFLAIFARKKFEDFHSLQEMIYIFNIFHFRRFFIRLTGRLLAGEEEAKEEAE